MADFCEYAASEAEAKFEELLDRVERGETVRITRHGKTIARILPESEARRLGGTLRTHLQTLPLVRKSNPLRKRSRAKNRKVLRDKAA